MNAFLDLDELTRKTRRLEFEDGLVDLLNAIVFLFCTLLFALIYSPSGLLWVLIMVEKYPVLSVGGLLALTPLLALFLLLAKRGIERFRREKIWRESGFVKPVHGADWRVTLLAVLAFVCLLSTGFWGTLHGWLAPDSDLRFMVSGIGIATGIMYFGTGHILKFARYILAGIAGSILSTMILLTPLSFSTSWALLGMIWSLILTLSGFVGLRGALRTSGEPVNG